MTMNRKDVDHALEQIRASSLKKITPEVLAAERAVSEAMEAQPLDLNALRDAATALLQAQQNAGWTDLESKVRGQDLFRAAVEATQAAHRSGGPASLLGIQIAGVIANALGLNYSVEPPDDSGTRH